MKKIFFKILNLILVLYFSTSHSSAESFSVVGHTQYLVSHKKEYQIFLDELNISKADYIFFLGDSNLGNKNIFNGLKDDIKKKIFSVPGNGEYKEGIESYVENIGYLNKDFETKNFVFLLLDSNQPLKNIQNLLKNWRTKYTQSDKMIILLTHHRIWDDSVISAKPYRHDKTFLFRDIFQSIDDFIDVIIAGNSKRQYFQDLPASLINNKPPNYSTTFWEETFQKIKAYNIGMGNGLPYASYVHFEIKDDELYPLSKTVKVSNHDLDNLGLVDMSKYSSFVRDKGNIKLTIKEKLIILYNRFKTLFFSFITGIIFTYFFINLTIKKNKTNGQHK